VKPCEGQQMEVSGELHSAATLPAGKVTRYASDRRLGGHQRRSGRCGEDLDSM
jgi:hypothetical protein